MDQDKIIKAIRRGDIEPALLGAIEEMVKGWFYNTEALRSMSTRDKISLINCLPTVQKSKGNTKGISEQEDAFPARLRLVNDAD